MKAYNNRRFTKKNTSRIWIILLILFLLITLISFVVLWKDSRTPEPDYELFEITRGTIENTSLATGKISPRNMVLVKPQISGIISELKKEPGDAVKVNEVIAVISVVPEVASLNAAQARAETARINYKLMQEEYDRQRTLFIKKVISRQEMDRVDAEYKKARVELDNANDNLNIVRSGVSASTGGHTQVRSTIDGTILNVPVKVGTSVIQSNTFNDGTTIATVADMNDMIFVGDLDESEIDKVYVGMPVNISIGALEKRTFSAQLEHIAPQGVEINGAILFEIKAAVHIPSNVTVRAGYSANAEMVLAKAENVLTVPESALHTENDGSSFIYVYRPDNGEKELYSKQYVTLGLSDGVNIQITGDNIREGDKVRGNMLAQKK